MPDTTQILTRIRAEYVEMPGLRLTLEQAARLFGVEWALCRLALDGLVEATFLCVTSNGSYARLTAGNHTPPPRAAKVARPLASRLLWSRRGQRP